jgi:uncharacterized protein (DUF1810 family)
VEAKTYLRHPILGERLRECAQLVVGVDGHLIQEIFGYPNCGSSSGRLLPCSPPPRSDALA